MAIVKRYRLIPGVLGLLLAALVSVPVSAGTAPAGAARQPDGRVRLQRIAYELFEAEKYDGPWIGNNIYNTTGEGQAAKVNWFDSTPGWQRWIFGVSVQNDGSSSDRIRIQATGTALDGWTVRYYDGSTNVTSAVVNGTFTTPSLSPGGSYVLKVKVTRDAESFDVETLRRLVSLTSVNNPNKVDAVRVVLKRDTCGC